MFWQDRSGNFSILVALLLCVIVASGAISMDLTLALSRRAHVQAAADAAVLSGAAMARTAPETLKKEIARVFKGNLAADLAPSTVIDSLTISDDNLITLTARSEVPLTLGKVVFGKTIDISVTAQSIRGDVQKAEIALVLDNTYSMSGRKLSDLKVAANALLGVFQTAANPNIRLSLIPFSRYVNVDVANRDAPWLTIPRDTPICSTRRPLLSKSGCRTVTVRTVNDGVPGTATREQCENYVYGEPSTTCSRPTWTGCVGSRPFPLDVSDEQPSIPYTGLLNTSCGAALMPLTSNYAALRIAVSKMVANNETYIPAGILWGLNSLSDAEPLSEAAPRSRGLSKFMVIMTDGANTLSPTPSNPLLHTGNNVAMADRLMGKVCDNAKFAGVTIFTVAVGVSDTTAASLAACASDAGKAYTVEQSSRLADVFRRIASQIMTPRLTR